MCRFCEDYSSLIPLTFVLAFYVSHVVSRWWAQWNAIPWPDSLAFKINVYCHGKECSITILLNCRQLINYFSMQDDETRLIRRNVTRYACLAIVETLRMVSSKVKKRFPTMEHLVDAGLLTHIEVSIFKNKDLLKLINFIDIKLAAIREAQAKSEYLNYTYWVPISWASSITMHAQEQGYIGHSRFVLDINEELAKIRNQCGAVISYDWISLPLVYTQVR